MCVRSGQQVLSEGMNKMLVSGRVTPRPRTPIEPFESSDDRDFEEDEETIRGWLNRIHVSISFSDVQ